MVEQAMKDSDDKLEQRYHEPQRAAFQAEYDQQEAEFQRYIDKGVAWLKSTQRPDGSFANPENAQNAADHPALTALPITALLSGTAPEEPLA